MFDGFTWVINLILVLAAIGVVFGVWKIIEIIILVLSHIKIV